MKIGQKLTSDSNNHPGNKGSSFIVAEEEKVNINGVNNTLTILPHPTSNMQNA